MKINSEKQCAATPLPQGRGRGWGQWGRWGRWSRLLFLLSLLLVNLTNVMAQEKSIVTLADPYILLDGDTYYAYGTGEADGIAVWTSDDLRHWTRHDQLALHKQNTTETQWFWAPEVYRKNGQYYMYYSANEHLYVATATQPAGPFRQVGQCMTKAMLGDEKCIDSSVYFDDDGQAWLFFVRFTDGNCIWMCQLDDDLMTPRPATLSRCISVSQPWEDKLGRVNEGPFVLKNNGIYYLTYSGNDFRSHDYAVGYAMSRTLAPANGAAPTWSKYGGNPIVHRAEGLYGTGHHSFFTDKEGRLRIVFHAHDSETEVYPRRMYIGTMEFAGNKLQLTSDPLIRPAAPPSDPSDPSDPSWLLEPMPGSTDKPGVAAYRDLKYNRLFTRTLGWNGGDGVLTVGLPNGDVLWTFNDSFYGVVNAEDRSRGDCNFPRNSIMVQRAHDGVLGETDNDLVWLADYVNCRRPTAGKYFHARTHLRHPQGNKTQAQINAGEIDEDKVYWSGDGTVVDGKLQMVWIAVESKELRNLGTALATYSLDGIVPMGRFVDTIPDYLPKQGDYLYRESVTHNVNQNTVSYGSTICDEANDGHLYLYGVDGFNVLVARTASNSLYSPWQYYVKKADGQWVWQDNYPVEEDMKRSNIMASADDACHLPWVFRDGDWYYLTSQAPIFSTEVYIYRSRTPYGPFTDKQLLFRLPDHLDKIGNQKYHWLYMVNLHPALSRSGELVFSTNSDPDDFWWNFNDPGSADYYRPYFYRVFNWKKVYDDGQGEEPTEPRTIKSFRDYRAKIGTTHTVNGLTISDPDIYYTDNGDGTYNAIRLTVQPDETPAEMTPPYLNQATANSIQIGWKTKAPVNDAIVRYGLSPEALTAQHSSLVTTQVADKYYWHTAQLTGLQPNTVYYYQVTSGDKTSATEHFRTLPQADSQQPFRILMIGDHQRNERSDYEWLLRMAERKARQKWGGEALEDNVRLLMNVGDQVDSGSVRQYELTHLYKSREVMSRLPIMTAVGNHELFKDPQLNLYKSHYDSYGNIAYQGIKSGTALYYAYQAGSVLFVVMNTDGTSDTQKQWVKSVVEAADNDATVKFIVSVQHRPLYAEQWASDTNAWMTDEVMPILSASRKHVLNCAGHHHLYARGQMTQWPVYHIISGGGVGTSAQDYEQLWGNTPDNRNRDEVQKTIDQWTYQLMEFDPVSEEMTVETYSIGNSRLALDNVLIDRFTRRLSMTDKPATPSLSGDNDILLPATISQATGEGELALHSSEYQIARDAHFTDIVYQRILLFEDFYDVDENKLPKNVRNGLPVTTLNLTASDLHSGNYFIRCRNRSMNLDWSDYSEAKAITVKNPAEPQLTLSTNTLKPGNTLGISYENAPVGNNAWIGIYTEGTQPGPQHPSYAWQYTQAASGTIHFTINDAGKYFAVLFGDNGYNEISMRVPFTVSNDAVGSLMLQKGHVTIVVPDAECSPVKLAVEALQRDFQKVLGFMPPVVSTAGTTDGVELVVANGAVEGSPVNSPAALDGFESHRVYADAPNHRIVLQGADMRGTIYAIYSFSEQLLGVPPLWYWCDWQPEQKEQIEVPHDFSYYQPSPAVRYRAWFPNDEDLFIPWRRQSTDNNELWLETMLRLKLNTVEHTATVQYVTTEPQQGGTLNSEAMLYKKYGLVLTSHHMVALNNSFANWDAYWQQVRHTTPPALSVNDMTSLREFWQYNINSVMNSGVENLWQVAFRGKNDQPFWAVFSDAPSSDEERAAVINRMVKEQYDMICQSTGEDNPFVRMTFYDEISSLLAAGHLQPPTATNMLWTFVAARRDHYPYDDLVNWTNTGNVKLGYYMNLQFYSTGAHLAPAEGPWKMEDNYRYVMSKGPLTFSVVNAGNLREFLMEMSANAAMMWNPDSYTTNDFLHRFCAQYFGEHQADEVVQLYRDYYHAYWNPKKSDFPGGFDRQYVFQDLRHSQVIKQVNATWDTFKNNPFTEIGFESVPGRTFRIEGSNPVDSVLAGMSREMEAFAKVARRCEALNSQLPPSNATFFYDHLSAYAHYMEQLSTAVYHFVYAYKNKDDDRYAHLKTAYEAMLAAKAALLASQHGVFSTWYATDDKFEMDARIEAIRRRLDEHLSAVTPPQTHPQDSAHTKYYDLLGRQIEKEQFAKSKVRKALYK